VSARSLTAEVAGLIEKETPKKRIMNIECRMSKYGILPVESLRVEQSILAKKIEHSDTTLRNSAVLRFAVKNLKPDT
jgi:hypothetical protein